jgi:hypothetical protein
LENKIGFEPSTTKSEEDPSADKFSYIRSVFRSFLSVASVLINPSPKSWQDSTSPSPEYPHNPKKDTINSVVLSAPIATLRNLAHLPQEQHGPPQSSSSSAISPIDSPGSNGSFFVPGSPPSSIISSFDPIQRGVITMDEAQRLFDIFFENCYPLAPFLCGRTQTRAAHVRTTSVLLFTSVCCIGARYWNYQHL